MQIDDIETPAVLIDLTLVEANIDCAQRQFDRLGKGFRPHVKTHKIPFLARLPMRAGAIGIACQKISEAEVFAAVSFNGNHPVGTACRICRGWRKARA